MTPDLHDRVTAAMQRARALAADSERIRQACHDGSQPVSRSELLRASQNARLVARLETLPVIEQAKGIIMAQSRCDAIEAFDLLRRVSQRANIPVHKLAAQIISRTVKDGRPVPERSASPAP